MSSTATAKQDKPVIKPIRKMSGHATGLITGILRLPSRRPRILTSSQDGSIRVWDLESGTQVGGSWKDEGSGVIRTISLSPDGTTVASGSADGAVRLWDIHTGKVVNKWTGHTKLVWSVCWSPDGGRVASGSLDHTLRVWNAKSGDIILGPIKATSNMPVFVSYSPDGTMLATNGHQLKIWDANTGELLKTIEGKVWRMAWTSDMNGKTLISIIDGGIKKVDVATWTETASIKGHSRVNYISLSVNERILASASNQKTARLWDLENDKIVGPPLYHEGMVGDVVFSGDGRFLASGCDDGRIYTWDVSAIIKEAGLDSLLSDNNTVNKSMSNADATRRRAPKIEGHRRIPQGFFNDSLPSRGPNAAPRQSHTPLSWAQNLISGMVRRRDGSNVQLPPIVEVPLTAGKPRNYHATKKPSASSSRPTKPPTTQQPSGGATQSNLSSSQQPPATATASTTPPAEIANTACLALEKFVLHIVRSACLASDVIEVVITRSQKPSALSFAHSSGVEITHYRDAF
ncbi:quinon protein alcohol dehydrogenase-like superfamily [Suillus subaureus]|uniref:Quinon protein alcohol dehydrogenase-like superfamily n=1 Tax=Suillus subaureus TaxID=48587 RepID=A0A9P7EBL1_9AGAM|nr:quinon protein alcohol dehydrogenase-like superfamily [Suillus subaureus]KAG1816880.1 quinon protein alcohol dehydrogenase-like superfamily [Suillus subaureus]